MAFISCHVKVECSKIRLLCIRLVMFPHTLSYHHQALNWTLAATAICWIVMELYVVVLISQPGTADTYWTDIGTTCPWPYPSTLLTLFIEWFSTACQTDHYFAVEGEFPPVLLLISVVDCKANHERMSWIRVRHRHCCNTCVIIMGIYVACCSS